jgi:hypothetical protein
VTADGLIGLSSPFLKPSNVAVLSRTFLAATSVGSKSYRPVAGAELLLVMCGTAPSVPGKTGVVVPLDRFMGTALLMEERVERRMERCAC